MIGDLIYIPDWKEYAIVMEKGEIFADECSWRVSIITDPELVEVFSYEMEVINEARTS